MKQPPDVLERSFVNNIIIIVFFFLDFLFIFNDLYSVFFALCLKMIVLKSKMILTMQTMTFPKHIKKRNCKQGYTLF